MNRSKLIPAVLVLAFMGATALVLLHMKSHQRLGEPGVLTRPMADSKNLEVLLPVTVPGFTSEIDTNAENALLQLPKDTSFRVRRYQHSTNFFSQVTVVLMDSDRSSIHKPQICMTGQGWAIDNARSSTEMIHLDRPSAYDLPVNKLIASKQFEDNGHSQTYSGIFVYWYVDADRFTASENQWMLWWMPRDLLLNGVLERWSYISVFSACRPEQEDATFDRMKKFIAEVVPDFQLVPRAGK
ncbi:MAG TPA: exosortase-associated EpsI family protein [Verrucomicrobiae bacterium]